MGVGSLAVLWTLAMSIQTYHIHKKKAIIYSQNDIIALILSGILLVTGYDVVYSTDPSLKNRVAKKGFIGFGSPLELAPLIIKISSINILARK